MRLTVSKLLFSAIALAAPAIVQANIKITEFMYQGATGADREFFEITNLGSAAVNIAGWSYNDNNPDQPLVFGAAVGIIKPFESIVFTEVSANAFRAYWGLSSSVRVFDLGGSHLGSGDDIRIYNSTTQNAGTLVDSLTYSGTTRGISRNLAYGTASTYVNSVAGDVFQSHAAPNPNALSGADLGNPGHYLPEPGSWALMIAGFGLVGAAMRRRATPRFA